MTQCSCLLEVTHNLKYCSEQNRVNISKLYLRYSSRLSLHSRVPFTRVFINFIRAISRRSRVTDSPHASHTSCAAATRESYFVQCTRVIHRVLHASQTWRAARESVLVHYTRVIVCSYLCILRTYHSKLNTKHANESK